MILRLSFSNKTDTSEEKKRVVIREDGVRTEWKTRRGYAKIEKSKTRAACSKE